MSLPPGFLEELRARVPLSRVVGRKVTWDLRKSNQGKGDFWAPCPFHQEKTASFHVDDAKGFYYCFGCHAKGDAVTFLRESENMGFVEAVEVLAREAGMAMPERDPRAAEAADRRTKLAEAMEAAVRHYRMMLSTKAGAAARDYLASRGLTGAALDRFEIGFAPPDRHGVIGALTAKGIAPDLILEAGLAKQPEGGGAPYDFFRDRIMFPIRDPRGRCIAFGGRAMSGEALAKYLNSPDTPLFDKGRTLYNAGPARAAAGKGRPLIVAEGYMDVIALVTAGFEAAVAPLGTAVRPEQLEMLWRIDPEPVVALDGDKAGIAAAMRLIDLALPAIAAGQSLRFAILPGGMDPDDLIRRQGAAAMQAAIDAAVPMVRLLWQRETEGKPIDSPERRAALDKSLKAAIARIGDASVRGHYAEEIRRLRADLFGLGRQQGAGAKERAWTPREGQGRGRQGRSGAGARADAAPLATTRETALARASGPEAEEHLREAAILAICLAHPGLVGRFESALETLDFTGPGHAALAQAVLRAAAGMGDGAETPEAFRAAVGAAAGVAAGVAAGAEVEKILGLPHVRVSPAMRAGADAELGAMCLAEELAKLAARRGAAAEIAEAEAELEGVADEGLTWRLAQAAAARHRAERMAVDAAEDGEDRAALSAALQRLIDGEVWVKKRR